MKSLLIILFVGYVLCTSGPCPGFNQDDLLQSGVSTLARGNLNSALDYSYQAVVDFQIPESGIDIAITTSNIQNYTPLPRQGFNYYVEAQRVQDENMIEYMIVIKNDGSWSSISLGYLISGRVDLAVGNLQFLSTSWVSQGSNIYAISQTIPKQLPNKVYQLTIFISGFSTSDPQFNLKITRKSFDKNQLSLIFYCSANPIPLSLAISYIIYPETHQYLQFNYANANVPGVRDNAYRITGPVYFGLNHKIQYQQWRVQDRNLVCNGNGKQCSKSCILKEECLARDGNVYKNQCVFCPPGVTFQDGKCTKKCRSMLLYLYGQCACPKEILNGLLCLPSLKVCGTLQKYSQSTKKCVCKDGYARFNDICVECPPGSQPLAGGQTCICPPHQFYDTKTNTCQNRCTATQRWFKNRCQCLQNHSWWNQDCRICPQSSTPTPNFSTCTCSSKTQAYNPQTNQCIQCGSPNSQITENKCTCQPGYLQKTINQNQICQYNIKCNPDSYIDGTVCMPCMQNCRQCSIKNQCTRCKTGFRPLQTTIQGESYIICEEICGDGQLFVDACDDGNLVDGDGCSRDCLVEDGWVCVGGDANNRSICTLGN